MRSNVEIFNGYNTEKQRNYDRQKYTIIIKKSVLFMKFFICLCQKLFICQAETFDR